MGTDSLQPNNNPEFSKKTFEGRSQPRKDVSNKDSGIKTDYPDARPVDGSRAKTVIYRPRSSALKKLSTLKALKQKQETTKKPNTNTEKPKKSTTTNSPSPKLYTSRAQRLPLRLRNSSKKETIKKLSASPKEIKETPKIEKPKVENKITVDQVKVVDTENSNGFFSSFFSSPLKFLNDLFERFSDWYVKKSGVSNKPIKAKRSPGFGS